MSERTVSETASTGHQPCQPDRNHVVCIAEDRQSCEPALRLLIASMDLHCPSLVACLYCPNASGEFVVWMARYPQHILNTTPLAGNWTKYDIKPLALLATLAAGHEAVVWLDSDILISRDFRGILQDLSHDMLAVSEEALCSGHADPDGLRARLWGFPVGRVLPFTVNTGVIRVTKTHVALLERWNGLLQSDEYRTAQAKPWSQRGLHVMGDQEVMTALLSSAEFSHFPIRYVRRGDDIIQYFGNSGYTLRERIRHLRRGLPFFIHSQGFRPWWPRETPKTGYAARFQALYNDLSPYTSHARTLSDCLTDCAWLTPPSRLARTLIALTGDRPALVGMPLALVADLFRKVKEWRGDSK